MVGMSNRTPLRAAPEPLEANDVATVKVGTTVWAVLFLGQLPFYGWYSDHGHTWMIWSCLVGVGLGFVGLKYTTGRRDAILRQARTQGPDADSGTQGGPGHDPGDGPEKSSAR